MAVVGRDELVAEVIPSIRAIVAYNKFNLGHRRKTIDEQILYQPKQKKIDMPMTPAER